MRILQHHADFFEFEPVKKEVKIAEEVEMKKIKFENVVVAFVAIEEGDDKNVIEAAVSDVKKSLDNLKVNKLLIYPYAHLSNTLAKPKDALKLIIYMEEYAKKMNIETHRAPFGWTKMFNLKIKAHPLAEQSKFFTRDSVMRQEKVKPVTREKKEVKAEQPKLTENDHRVIGQKLDFYSFHEEAPGMVFFHSKGMIIRNVLTDFWREEHRKRGYQEINTPVLMNKKIWETSGHWDHYKDNMFFTEVEDMDFALKPMNCPGAILVYKNTVRSYRDLPLRLAELGLVNRNELSGVLSGLFRLRSFTQDDAHIFVQPEKIEEEILKVVDLIDHFYKIFGFPYHVELSTRPENAMGDKQIWDKAEKALEEALKQRKMNYKINPGDGAFYGPKIDFHIKDSMGRTWQCATVQLDLFMPERFNLNYVGSDDKQHKPVIIHRVIYGAIERFIGILVEHYKGELPVWLSPLQVRVLPVSDKHVKYAEKIRGELLKYKIRIDMDDSAATLEYKVRNAEMQKIPYILTVGEKEEGNDTVAVRTRGKKEVEFKVKVVDFVRRMLDEINSK